MQKKEKYPSDVIALVRSRPSTQGSPSKITRKFLQKEKALWLGIANLIDEYIINKSEYAEKQHKITEKRKRQREKKKVDSQSEKARDFGTPSSDPASSSSNLSNSENIANKNTKNNNLNKNKKAINKVKHPLFLFRKPELRPGQTVERVYRADKKEQSGLGQWEYAVFDGSHPYPLNWPNKKPGIIIEAHYMSSGEFEFVEKPENPPTLEYREKLPNTSNPNPDPQMIINQEVEKNSKIVLKDKTPPETVPEVKVADNNKSKSQINNILNTNSVKSMKETLQIEKDLFLRQQLEEEKMTKTLERGAESAIPKMISSSKEVALETPSTSKLKEVAHTSAPALGYEKTEPNKNKNEKKSEEGGQNRKGQEPLPEAKGQKGKTRK